MIIGTTFYISLGAFLVCFVFQSICFVTTRKARKRFVGFFERKSDYAIVDNGEDYPQIELVGGNDSDLNYLIKEINTYLYKTKGTSDYEFIQDKVERKLNMLYDQSTVYLSFPTYIGLMGTFLGVLIGISMFIGGFDDAGNISDDSISNLLTGVLVSMLTSLFGLGFTTYNTHKAGDARKKIENDKNEFFDFIQTEVTKTASASLVSAIGKLHDTVDKFEPAFNRVINRFQTTFDKCTKAFGDNFEKNVAAVADAVDIMGKNMDKINDNIELQKRMIDTVKSSDMIRGMNKYIEAANHFVGITQSLDKFEEARRMMLAAAQEAIEIQNKYSESLKVPREIAVNLNKILNRITDFESTLKEVSTSLKQRDVLGNDVLNSIQDQISGISKKGKIADKFLQMSDGKLTDLYEQQTKVLAEMNRRYKEAIEGHINGFEEMIKNQTNELESRHKEFLQMLEIKFNADDIRAEFSNLKRLNEIFSQLRSMANDGVKSNELVMNLQNELRTNLQNIQNELGKIESVASKAQQPVERRGWFK
jgi:hypothetical protein